MAELYLSQGHPERARAIYAHLATDPTNVRARERLAEIDRQSSGGTDFKALLQKIVESVDGALACSLMGFDGIAVEHVEAAPGAVDLQTMLIEYSSIVKQIRAAARSLAAGETSEVSIRTEKVTAVARLLTDSYFAVVALSPEGNVGKARYALRVGAAEMVRALAT